jgi:hypothetical protein
MSYADWLKRQLPAGFAKPEMLATMQAAGQLLDAQEDLMRQSILAGFPTMGALDSINFPPPAAPQYALAPSDALDAIGFDRGLPRGVAESPADNGGTKDQAYAARLLGAWQAWKYGGSHYGLLRALQIAGYADMVIVQQNGRSSQLTGSAGTVADMTLGSLMTCADRLTPWVTLPHGWTFTTGDQTFWSIFGIVFTSDATNLQSNGDGSVSPGQATLLRIVLGWKPSKMIFDGAYVILSGLLMGWPTGRALGTDPNLGGNSVRIIPGSGARAFVEGP